MEGVLELGDGDIGGGLGRGVSVLEVLGRIALPDVLSSGLGGDGQGVGFGLESFELANEIVDMLDRDFISALGIEQLKYGFHLHHIGLSALLHIINILLFVNYVVSPHELRLHTRSQQALPRQHP